jgi:hypothetical protein
MVAGNAVVGANEIKQQVLEGGAAGEHALEARKK